MESIGIRELRQHASRWLRRVEQGESFEVTDRGRPIALLAPVDHRELHLTALLRSGAVKAPTVARPPHRRTRKVKGLSASQVLADLRAEDGQ